MRPGSTSQIDIFVSTSEKVCDLGCTHAVTEVARRTLRVVEARPVPNLWAWGYVAPSHPAGAEPPKDHPGYRAVDAEGTGWSRDWDGWHSDAPGSWASDEGLRGEEPLLDGRPRRYRQEPTRSYTVQVDDRVPAHQLTLDL